MADVHATVAEAARNLRYGGPSVLLEFLSRTYLRWARSVDATRAFEEAWDLLVVLDACRADVLASVADEYRFLDRPGTVNSAGGTTTEWLRETFGPADDDVLAGTTYVTGNPYSRRCLDADRLERLDEVWAYAWDDDLGTIPPRPLTDRAVAHAREADPDRLVVHYMQPHFPSVADPECDYGVALDAFGERSLRVWEDLRFGRRDEAAAWLRYRENLRYVLDEVELLLENVNADRVVVTADHGNAFGEWHLYGHAEGVALPCLREVPWYVTSTTDERTYDHGTYAQAAADRTADEETDAVERRLEQLGYR